MILRASVSLINTFEKSQLWVISVLITVPRNVMKRSVFFVTVKVTNLFNLAFNKGSICLQKKGDFFIYRFLRVSCSSFVCHLQFK